MDPLSISEVAAATGFSTSTLRYYEDIGLLPGVERSESGYRVFDDRAVQRLRLIARAKTLGLSLDEISEVASIWDRDECAPVQARLVALATEKSQDARTRSAQLNAFADELDAALQDLSSHTAAGACDDQCGCTAVSEDRPTPVTVTLGRAPIPSATEPVACTLASDALDNRLDEWRAVLSTAVHAESTAGGTRFRFKPNADVASLASLAAAEQRCCSFLTFGLGIDASSITLDIRGRDDAQPLLDAFMDLAR